MQNKNYNSNREHLVLPEYGRHIFGIVKALKQIEDRQERIAAAHRVIEIMGNMNPSLRDSPLFSHKLWDHLYIMADFDLDIESPYPVPSRNILEMHPRRIAYPRRRFTHKQYGNNIREVLNKLKDVEDEETVQSIASDVARFMKYKSYEYNQEYPSNDVIIKDIHKFTDGGIVLEESALEDTKLDYSSKKAVQQRLQQNGSSQQQQRKGQYQKQQSGKGGQQKYQNRRNNNNK